MSYAFSQNGNIFKFVNTNLTVSHDFLPGGFYKFGKTIMGFHIEQLPSEYLTNDGKLYGSVSSRTTRILNSFKDRNRSTGILLSGSKGTGKTLLMRNVGVEAAKMNYPVFIIDEPYHESDFIEFIEQFQQPIVMLFDEYEKMYDDNDAQDDMLRLFDGVTQTNILSVLAVNTYPSEYLIDRPGRMFYHFKYGTLEEQFVREYSVDNLKNQDNVDSLVAVSKLYKVFSFDILKAYVEDMNRYNESAREVMNVINAEVSTYDVSRYVRITQNGETYTYWDSETILNPLSERNICITPYGAFPAHSQKKYIPASMDVFDDGYEGGDEVPEKEQLVFTVKKDMVTKHKNGSISIDVGNDIVVWFHTNRERTLETEQDRIDRKLAEQENNW